MHFHTNEEVNYLNSAHCTLEGFVYLFCCLLEHHHDVQTLPKHRVPAVYWLLLSHYQDAFSQLTGQEMTKSKTFRGNIYIK